MSERAYTEAELKQLVDERADELVKVFFKELKKDEGANAVQHTSRAVATAMGAFLDIAFREENTRPSAAAPAARRLPPAQHAPRNPR